MRTLDAFVSEISLLIQLDGCHAESFSNEQGQELDNNLTTCYNDLEQQ